MKDEADERGENVYCACANARMKAGGLTAGLARAACMRNVI